VGIRDIGTFAAAVLLGLMISAGEPLHAQHVFDRDRDYVINKPCKATRSIRQGGEPTALRPGETFKARGVNKASDPSHVLLRIGASGKWAPLDCGQFTDGQPVVPPPVCRPFFDTVDNPVDTRTGRHDITPPAPMLTAFDVAAAGICGAPGTRVTKAQFRSLFTDHPDVLSRLMAFTGNSVFADRKPRPTAETYLDDLVEAWFHKHGFDHIFCGEPERRNGRKSIGGLHFHARYLALQETGAACRLDNHASNEVSPGVIYSMGVIMHHPKRGVFKHPIKGYGLTLSGEDLFKVVTRAFVENPSTQVDQSEGCLLSVEDDGQTFKAVFVRRKGGIRTFFPDATPNAAHDSRRNAACGGAIRLP
jgi:hypothetical protein